MAFRWALTFFFGVKVSAHFHIVLDAVDPLLHMILMPYATDHIRVGTLARHIPLEKHVRFSKGAVEPF